MKSEAHGVVHWPHFHSVAAKAKRTGGPVRDGHRTSGVRPNPLPGQLADRNRCARG